MMLSAIAKKTSVKDILKLVVRGFSIFFIAMFFFMVFHDSSNNTYSQTAEYCTKYGFLASPDCW